MDTKKILIKTDHSFLELRNSDDNLIKIINHSVNDIRDKLLDKQPILMFGKIVYQKRSIGFFSNVSIGYKYSKKLVKSQKLTDNLKLLLEEINKLYKTDYNGILVNRYANGEEYIGKHSDDESSLSNTGVVSISYGAIRKFRIRNNYTGKIIKDILTEPYSLLRMAGNFQKEFTHEIPIEKKIIEERISFTFRKHLE